MSLILDIKMYESVQTTSTPSKEEGELKVNLGYEKTREANEAEEKSMCDEVYVYVEKFLYVLFVLVVTASVLVVLTGIALDYCILQFNPAALYVILAAALTLLAYVEALHYSNVAVEKWDMTPYAER